PCSNGRCAPCSVNDKQCNGSTPQTCNAAGSWVDDRAPCPFVCDAMKGCVGECVPGSDDCASGSSSRHCGASGFYGAATTCPNVCDASTGRCGGVCPPGAHRCNGSTAQTCSAGGQWGSDIICSLGCNVAVGECNPCTDEAMSVTCMGGKCGDTPNNC